MIAGIKIRLIDFFRKSTPETGAAPGYGCLRGRGRLGVNLI
jgi:hypothetical protein